jgi:hypothetical protein
MGILVVLSSIGAKEAITLRSSFCQTDLVIQVCPQSLAQTHRTKPTEQTD